ncbi:MAG: arylsulfatase [Flammeovirgaceae bacterium]|nr:arylsulfatase [Flammeovirgaceae bacterium]
MMIKLFNITFVLLLTFGCKTQVKKEQLKVEKPNVILILADDMGWSDLGCYGSEVETPNLDKMAFEGMRFTQVYNTAKCFPSRACLLTGLYSQQTGYNKNFKQPINNAITLGELFQSEGYTTMWSGKHHSTENPITRGFDHYSGLLDGACNYFNPGMQREGEGQPVQKRNNRTWCIEGEEFKPYTPESKDFYTTDVFTDYALGWLDQHKEEKKPFFLYMAYNAPHDPLMAWPEDIAKYRGKYREGYEVIRQKRFAKQKEMGLLSENYPLSESMHKKWEELTEEEKDEEDLVMAVYAAMIDRLDQNIGRLQSKLKALKVAENTLIIFVSDNGASSEVVNINGSGEIGSMTEWTSLKKDWANVANTPLRYYKNYSYEGGIKTPMIAYWPKGLKNKNTISDTPLHFIDFMSTFSELSGATYPTQFREQEITPMQGISFLPLLKGEEINRNQPLFWEWAKGRAIRDGDWKLVAFQGKWALFNLKTDPVEQTDLSETNPDKLNELKAKFDVWAKEVGNVDI